MKAVIQEDLYHRSRAVFDGSDIEYFVHGLSETKAMLEQAESSGAMCFIIGAEKYPDSFYLNMKPKSMVVRYGVGYNHVPISICRERNIYVSYTPGTLDQSVAEHTAGMILACARNIPRRSREMKKGEWITDPGIELKDKICAVIGFGNIGRRVAGIMRSGFGMTVHGFDIIPGLDRQYPDLMDAYSTDFSTAVQDADIVTLHMAATPETENFINGDRLDMMKKGALFVNTARGALVDEDALYERLQQGHLSCAAVDVYKDEPYSPPGSRDLRELDTVILTPHIGSNTDASNRRMAETCVHNITAFCSGNLEKVILIPEMKG